MLADGKELSIRQLGIQVGALVGNPAKGEALVQNVISGKSKSPRAENLEGIARVLGTTTQWLLSGDGDESGLRQDPSDGRGFTPTIIPGRELVGEKDFPVYAAAKGGDGHAIITFEAIDWVKRPSVLENVKNAYGIYIVGDSMIPAFEQGDTALVHPHLPPARNRNAVFYHTPPVDEAEAIVKRLLNFDDRDWRLRQWNPPEGEEQDFTVARADWPICHMIVGKYEAR